LRFFDLTIGAAIWLGIWADEELQQMTQRFAATGVPVSVC